MDVRVALAGFGSVGKAFVLLACAKEAETLHRYGIRLRVSAIAVRRGAIWGNLQPETLAQAASDNGEILALPGAFRESDPLDASLLSRAHVLVDATSGDMRSGEPGLSLMRKALQSNLHAVTLSKSAIALAHNELRDIARARGLTLKSSGATAAALPCLDLLEVSLSGATVNSMYGILNGTTNYVLLRMEQGVSLEIAVQEAIRLGIAEPDPGSDLEGWDTALKLVILCNAAMDARLRLGDIQVRGIEDLNAEVVRAALSSGRRVKLIGRAFRRPSGVKAFVGPEELDTNHPLASLSGREKGITVETDTMGTISLTGGRSDPRGAAAAAYKDVINIFRVES